MAEKSSSLSDSGGSSSKPSAFHVIAKPRGAVCNLSCEYCFYLPKERLYPDGNLRMTNELLEGFIRQQIEAHLTPEITFNWQGGEPTLMGLDFFQRAVTLQQKYLRPSTQILNTLQTNGTTLDEAWCRFFRENRFLVGISLDGPRSEHDRYRIDKRGDPTFDRVMHGVELLLQHQVAFNVLTCVHSANANRGPVVYRFLRDAIHARFIQFIPIVEHNVCAGGTTSHSITGSQYGDFLISVFDEWVRHDVGRVFVQIFDVALGIWFGHPSTLCVFAETCGNAPALEHNGDVFSCDHFVDPDHLIGNIAATHLAEIVTSPRQQAFGLDKRLTLPRCCRECTVLFACNGGCPKDRVCKSSEGEPGLNVFCKGFLAFFTHIDRSMRIMAELLHRRRSPAGIMDV
jgi:uncharacterized protein